ncbi:MAG: hypothetical protein IPJ61_21210 [Tessaracoccus sp.]|uniref:hypothetical protein n=1 Tax=Tessaracoccus sp. TaxID=1971211 RepID=UPI001EC45DF4|nr:hypothetical protein [Tessaracoccus sp.]MBK7823508.1 hypothetical protein [Tessaracoccus sp.]
MAGLRHVVGVRNKDDLHKHAVDRRAALPKAADQHPPAAENFDTWFDALTPTEPEQHLQNK